MRSAVGSGSPNSRAVLAIDLLRPLRDFALRLTDGLSEADLVRVPEGASNNVLWNLGHIAVQQLLLCYRPAGLALHVPGEAVTQFGKGTSPADWATTPDVGQVRAWLQEGPERLAEDVAAGRFTTWAPYATSLGVVLTSIEEAVEVDLFHEGMHVGTIKALLRQMA